MRRETIKEVSEPSSRSMKVSDFMLHSFVHLKKCNMCINKRLHNRRLDRLGRRADDALTPFPRVCWCILAKAACACVAGCKIAVEMLVVEPTMHQLLLLQHLKSTRFPDDATKLGKESKKENDYNHPTNILCYNQDLQRCIHVVKWEAVVAPGRRYAIHGKGGSTAFRETS